MFNWHNYLIYWILNDWLKPLPSRCMFFQSVSGAKALVHGNFINKVKIHNTHTVLIFFKRKWFSSCVLFCFYSLLYLRPTIRHWIIIKAGHVINCYMHEVVLGAACEVILQHSTKIRWQQKFDPQWSRTCITSIISRLYVRKIIQIE